MKLNEVSVKRFIGVLMFVCVITIMGGVSIYRLPMDLLPDIQMPTVMVLTEYEGAAPHEVETRVSRPIEEVISTLSNLENISSYSSPGGSAVIASFSWGQDMDFAAMEAREKLDLIRYILPEDASDPVTFTLDPSLMPIMEIAVEGEMDETELTNMVEEVIKPRLERVEGVAAIEVSGGVTPEIIVEISLDRLAANKVNLEDLGQSLFLESLNYRGGELTEGGRLYLVRTLGQFSDIEEMKEIVVGVNDAGPVKLGDVTEIRKEESSRSRISRLDGNPNINLSVQKQSDANTVVVAELVNEEIEKMQSELHGNLNFVNVIDQSTFIKDSIGNVTQMAMIGGLLAIIILFLFLRSLSATLVIGSAIPISLLGTFILMYFQGFTINIITLGGLALGVGVMVDNSIVVLENIYRHRSLGYDYKKAATLGSGQVISPIIAATLTTIVVFLPVVYVEGIARIMFQPLAFTVSLALIVSLIISMTWVPALSSRLPMNLIDNFKPLDYFQNAFEWLTKKYSVWLSKALRRPLIICLLALLLLIGSLGMGSFIGGEFIPDVDTSQLIVNVRMPVGTSLEETDKTVQQVESVINQVPEVVSVFCSVGTGGLFGLESASERAVIYVQLQELAERDRDGHYIAEEMRGLLSEVPGALISVSLADFTGGGDMESFMGAEIHFTIKGDDLEILQNLSDEAAEIINQHPGTRNIQTSFDEGRPEIQIRLDREKASFVGVTTPLIGNLVEIIVGGTQVSWLEQDGDMIEIYLKGAEEYRTDSSLLSQASIVTPLGTTVPLNQIADITYDAGPTVINREDQSRAATVTGQLAAGYNMQSVNNELDVMLEDIEIPLGYQMESGGEMENMMQSFETLGFALLLAIALVYMIMAAQFESLLFPFIVMFTLPQGLTGVVIGLLITGYSLSVLSLIGVILLSGIVVNNGIILVDYINKLYREEGMPLHDALIEAGSIRLRPIMMTTLTTITGMIPLVLGFGEGAEIQAPMATVVVGGLAVSTVMTLFLVPSMYLLLDRAGKRVMGIYARVSGKSVSAGK